MSHEEPLRIFSETLFFLVNSGTIRVAKTLQGNLCYCISNIDDFEALLELENQCDNINELANLDFSTPYTELQTEKSNT